MGGPVSDKLSSQPSECRVPAYDWPRAGACRDTPTIARRIHTDFPAASRRNVRIGPYPANRVRPSYVRTSASLIFIVVRIHKKKKIHEITAERYVAGRGGAAVSDPTKRNIIITVVEN